jgi:hypothetical protein
MNTNRYLIWITALMLSGIFCAYSAMADIARPPEEYHRLTAVQLSAGNAPSLKHGVTALSDSETRFKERLPLQLRGAMSKIKRTKYRPSRR